MATYAIGDIQGCYHAFSALLTRINFDAERDKLWLVGDLVNRGSGSLEVLRWCYQYRDSIRVALGNHDLHALAVMYGQKSMYKGDTLEAAINAPDSHNLFTWLRHQPLMIVEGDIAMVHAGLYPQWTISQASKLAGEVEHVLQAPDFKDFLKGMYGNTPAAWHDDLEGLDRLRGITNAMTRMRICTLEGEMEFTFKGELSDIPAGHVSWFDLPNRKSADTKIICGHWSALGLQQRENIFALDTGCLWGGLLTAMCLETYEITQVPHDVRDVPKPRI